MSYLGNLFRYMDERKHAAPDHPQDRRARAERKRQRKHRKRMKRRGQAK